MSSNDGCMLIEYGDGAPGRPCQQRAEYSVTTLVDLLYACPPHLRWAQDTLRAKGERSAYPGDDITTTALLHPEDWPSGFPGLWTTIQAADYWGVKPATYRDYISAGYAPSPVQMRDPRTGAKLHDASAVRSAFAKRPGRGARTDLDQAPG